ELATTYKDLFSRSTEVCKALEKQKKLNGQLQAERYDHLAKIAELNQEIIKLNADLAHVRKQVKMMSKGTEQLDEIPEKQSFGKPKP
ncbi:hypothetical protein A2U01_0085081, partial [Trifolium medium]|nr:hypothetical protein [Trifolium medium]